MSCLWIPCGRGTRGTGVCQSNKGVFVSHGEYSCPPGGNEEKVQLTVTLVTKNGGPVNRKSDKDYLKVTQEGVDDKAEQ